MTGSVSHQAVGRSWSHDIRNHRVYCSTRSLTRLREAYGWRLADTFHSSKYVNTQTIVRHVEIKTRLPLSVPTPGDVAVWPNLGERGLMLQRV